MRAPFPVLAEIAPGADPNADPATWNFSSDGIRWRQKAGLTFTIGEDDEDDEVKPGSAEAEFDDRNGDLSPRNVLGRWYGEITNNTPMRYVLGSVEDDYARVSASGWSTEPRSEQSWIHTNTGNWAVNGSAGTYVNATSGTADYALLNGSVGYDVDIYKSTSISATPTGGSWVDATIVRRTAAGTMYRAYTEFATDGTIKVKITRFIGSTTELTGLVATGVAYSPGTVVHTHVQAIGRTIQVRVWTGGTEPTTWNASVEDSMITGAGTGLYEWRLATNVGSLTLTVDNFRVSTSLWTGQVPEWPVRWPSKSGADCVTPVSASGVLRWLDQAQPALTDPISQQLSAQEKSGYWTLYDGSGATSAGSKIARPAGIAAPVNDGSFGNEDAPGGATTSLQLNTKGTSRITGTISKWASPQDGYSVMAYFRFPALPAASPAVPLLTITAPGTVWKWVVTVDAATFNLTGYDYDNVQVTTTTGQIYVIDPTQWFALQIEVVKDGGNADYAMIWHQVGSEDFYAAGSTYVAHIETVNRVVVQAAMDGMLVSNLWVGRHTLPFVNGTFMRVSSGFAGELDIDRIPRVLSEAGIDVVVEPGDGIPLGAQPRGMTAVDVAKDSERAGWGNLIERGAVMHYLPFSARVNVPVAMTLDFAQGHIAETPEPVDDDLELINRWTSSRPSGSERTAEDAESIEKRRLYADGGEANVYLDSQLDDDAGWHVAVGARDVLRWPRVTFDLHKNPQLISTWLGCRQGSRVLLANLPEQVAGELGDCLIAGYEQTIRKHYWRVELFLTPATPWVNVAVWGTARAESTSTTLAEDLDASETGINITTVYREDCWATAGGYIWDINGEPMSVTSVTSPAGSAGAYTQTATVVRSPTLAKTHATGLRVRLDRSQQVRWGLRH